MRSRSTQPSSQRWWRRCDVRKKADRDALNSLVNRAESALYTLGEWYCADVGCKHCRARKGCEAPQRIADAAYKQAVEDECDE